MALVIPLFQVIVMDLMDWMHANNYASVVTLLNETQNGIAVLFAFKDFLQFLNDMKITNNYLLV